VSDSDPELSRLYCEASAEGPPAAVDAAILAAARKRAAKPQRPARSSWVRWMAPASALATLAVAVSLALLVEREQPGTTRDTRIHPITPRLPDAAPGRATEAAQPKAADTAAPAAAAKKEAPAAVAPVPAPPVALPAQPPAAALPAPAPRTAEPAAPAAQAFPSESRAKAAGSGISAPAETETKTMRESNVAGDAAQRGASAAAPAAPAAAGRVAPLPQRAMQRSPEAWLDEISRLKREGREKEAAEQLAEFRKAYPAYTVPEALTASP
jgi:hypothetical protein